MESIRSEVSSILPITFHRKQIPSLVHRDDRVWSAEANRLKQQICKLIKDPSLLENEKQVLIVQGGYGCGKTTLLRRVNEGIGNDDSEFRAESLWFTQFNAYSSLEQLFLFLADKAESLGMRDASQILRKTTGELADRKDAAFNVFYHCKVLFIDDIDANGRFDFKFLSKIACKELTIVATCTDLQKSGLTASKVVYIPDKIFYEAENSSILPNEITPEETDAIKHLAERLGPTFGSILFQSIAFNVLAIEEALNLALQVGNHDELVECLFLKIFSKLPTETQNVLLDVAFIRTPLPYKDDGLFHLPLSLGLLKRFQVSDGKWVIQTPACIMNILKKLEIGNHGHLIANRSERVPTSLDLWMKLLPAILVDLIKKAEDHAWPFVPEAWQYKDLIGDEEKYNLKDVIHKQNLYADIDEIDILKECLFSALVEQNYKSASAVLFIIDRFIYWQGLSNTGIKVAEYIERKSPDTAIAPQIIIRKVRVMKNDGNIQGADKALNSLIESKEKLGKWIFKTESDQQLVTSVCVQIKGDIFRGLGLWARASVDLIKSIFGFQSLPKVDKKGWASSLSLLADAYQYMSMDDFARTIKPRFQLTSNHPILEAIKCVNEASQLSIYSPLFFTKNKRRAGELMHMYTKVLPGNSHEVVFYLRYAATELIEGLKCHTSVSSLQSREQFYEFVFCVYKLSQVLRELYELYRNRGSSLDGTAESLFALSLKLFEHYCSFQIKIEHDDWSTMLIQTTLLLLNLPKLPLNENPKLPATEAVDSSSSVKKNDKETTSASSLQKSEKGSSTQNISSPSQMKTTKFIEDAPNQRTETHVNGSEVTKEGDRLFQNQSTVETDEVDQRNATTATDTAESDDRGNYREEITASSNQSLLQLSECQETSSNEEGNSDKMFQEKLTVATEEDGMDALREELEQIRMHSRNVIGTDSPKLLERKLVHDEIMISRESAEVSRQWADKTNYIQNVTTATETDEKTDDDSLVNDRASSREFLLQAHSSEEHGKEKKRMEDIDVIQGIEHSNGMHRGEVSNGVDYENEDAAISDPVVAGDPEVIDEEIDSGIEVFRSNTTYLTEEDYMSNENSKKRMKTTMATIEGTISTREENALQIENTMSVIRHSKAKVYRAKIWRYDPLTSEWSTSDTLAYVGEKLKLSSKEEGNCRDAFMVEYINQEEPMARYIGKQYKLEKYKENPRSLKQYKQDVVCQVTSRYYATLFSQEMFRKGLPFGQVQFLPAVILGLTDVANDPEKYYNVEPYMAGKFTKISNNLSWVRQGDVAGKDLLLALGHFSYCASRGRIIIVDIQGWTSQDKTGATFLTDPQIHSKDKKGYGTANKGQRGFDEFWASQHPKCNDICRKLGLRHPKCSN